MARMEEVLFSIEAGVGKITINRPEKSNALNRELIRQLRSILQESAENHEVRLITITGAGEKAFCAGADLRASLLDRPGGEGFGRSEFRQLLVDIVQFPKPTITLVRGHAMGGGVGIVLASDLSLACDDVCLATSEIQVGLFPMMVMGLLYRNVGRKKATEMMFLGERITALQAQEYGIINHAYSRETFDKSAAEFIAKIAAKSADILKMGKEAIGRLLDDRLAAEEKYLESALADVMATEDSREGIRAFVEKRPPKWN